MSTLGAIPNVHAVMAESPQTLRAYQRPAAFATRHRDDDQRRSLSSRHGTQLPSGPTGGDPRWISNHSTSGGPRGGKAGLAIH